jgi:hypothetical protein
MNPAVLKLLKTKKRALDELYKESKTGEIPEGSTEGWAVVFPGTFLAPLVAAFARWFLWQGKVFDPETATLRNKITPFRIKAIKAKVYRDKSWLDGEEMIAIDYSKTSIVARMVHDEIREVEPRIYLGKVYLWKWKTVDFVLVSQSATK